MRGNFNANTHATNNIPIIHGSNTFPYGLPRLCGRVQQNFQPAVGQ